MYAPGIQAGTKYLPPPKQGHKRGKQEKNSITGHSWTMASPEHHMYQPQAPPLLPWDHHVYSDPRRMCARCAVRPQGGRDDPVPNRPGHDGCLDCHRVRERVAYQMNDVVDTPQGETETSTRLPPILRPDDLPPPRQRPAEIRQPESYYLPVQERTYMPAQGQTYMPAQGQAYMPTQGQAYMPTQGQSYMPNHGQIHMPVPKKAYTPAQMLSAYTPVQAQQTYNQLPAQGIFFTGRHMPMGAPGHPNNLMTLALASEAAECLQCQQPPFLGRQHMHAGYGALNDGSANFAATYPSTQMTLQQQDEQWQRQLLKPKSPPPKKNQRQRRSKNQPQDAPQPSSTPRGH